MSGGDDGGNRLGEVMDKSSKYNGLIYDDNNNITDYH